MLIGNNTVGSNDGVGIKLFQTSSSILENNTMSGNKYNLEVDGYLFSHFDHTIGTDNKVDAKPVYYWVNEENKDIPGDAGYVGVVGGRNIKVQKIHLSNNGQGVLFAFTEDSEIGNVTVSANDKGIHLVNSNDNTVSRNVCSSNNKGIVLNGSSENNLICHNNFIDNETQAEEAQNSNMWDNGYPCGGNYWSDYEGIDVCSGPYQNEPGSDGIGDTPYEITGYYEAEDNYPLMEPYQAICGDVNRSGKATVSDGRRIFLHILDPDTYPICCPWAADVTGNGKITVSDGRRIFLHILDPDTYPLECQ
jgi:parallel beta-helix repeat protein